MKHRQLLSFNCLLVTIALAACAGPGSHWHKEGVTETTRDNDYSACRGEARDTTGAGIDADRAASRQNMDHGLSSGTDGGSDDAAREANHVLITCMEDKGYSGY